MKTIQPKDPGLFDHENRMKKLAEGPDLSLPSVRDIQKNLLRVVHQ